MKEEGGLATVHTRAGGRTRARAIGWWQPGDGGVGSHAGEAGEEREKGEGGGDR
jgi:hypothetical protein